MYLVRAIGAFEKRSHLTVFLDPFATVKLTELIGEGKDGRLRADPVATANLMNKSSSISDSPGMIVSNANGVQDKGIERGFTVPFNPSLDYKSRELLLLQQTHRSAYKLQATGN